MCLHEDCTKMYAFMACSGFNACTLQMALKCKTMLACSVMLINTGKCTRVAKTFTLLTSTHQVLSLMKRLKAHEVTYGFCKNLTEQLIGSYHMQPYPVCISRPSGVGAVAKLPCPGYIGNSAAVAGMILSIACGEPCRIHFKMDSAYESMSSFIFLNRLH